MKIQCDSCGKEEAEVLCCADEAVLCPLCDETVHAANKLSSKHQRVPLVRHQPSDASAQSPFCDICQERKGYIFCVEDRALLCRNCDVGMHYANPFASSHRRLLITGVQVAHHSNLQPRQEEEIAEANRDLADSSADTMAEFPGLQDHRETAGMLEQWPAIHDILDHSVFDNSYDFSDLRSL